MPLEATMFCLDNSEWMRNGDLSPTRLRSLVSAVQSLATAFLRDNIESTTGFLTMADKKVDVQLSPCKNMGKMIKLLNELTPVGKCDIVTSLKIAQLTLKNRQNKSQRQRILLFIGSPIEHTSEELIEVGKMLKKNNVSVDAVLFGAESSNSSEKLEALIATVNNQDNSHLVVVPSGPHRLVDILNSSPLAIGGGGRPSAATVGTNQAATTDELDLLMETDPELAMALRMSLEDVGGSSAAPTVSTPAKPIVTHNASVVDDGMDDDDEELAAAIALSLQMEEEETRQREEEEAAKKKKEEETAAETSKNTTNNTEIKKNVNTIVQEDAMNDDKLNELLDQLANAEDSDLTDLLEQLGKEDKEKPAK